MRYSLRNQDKIKAHFDPNGEAVLKRIIGSLDSYFTSKTFDEEDIYHSENNKYDILTINDSGNSSGLILFYVISRRYNVLNLAFKEFVG